MSILDKIDSVRSNFLTEIESLPETPTEIQKFRSKYFGRRGEISILFSEMAEVKNDQRPLVGKSLNTFSGDSNSFIKLQRWITSVPLDQRIEKTTIIPTNDNKAKANRMLFINLLILV